MPGKKQKRYSQDGHLLPDNLYQDSPGVFRYRRPDGTVKMIRSDNTLEVIKTAQQANEIGEMHRQTSVPVRDSIIRHVEMFIKNREDLAPKLKGKESWANYQCYLRQFAKVFNNTPVNRLELLKIQKWWNTLSGNAQRSRRAEFNKFFNFLMAKEAVPRLKGNPFSTSDDKPRVMLKPREDKKGERLTLGEFWQIYTTAQGLGFEFLRVGMGISLLTTLRRGDILRLTFDANIVDKRLLTKVSKSHEKAERGKGVNLKFDLTQHTELNKLINRARELSLKHGRCPYLISHKFDRIHKLSANRGHPNQVLPRYFSDAFGKARDYAGVQKDLPKKHRAGFHEIRSLSSYIMQKAGHDVEAVQKIMAHTDPSMTEHYQWGHETEWHDANIVISPADLFGASF